MVELVCIAVAASTSMMVTKTDASFVAHAVMAVDAPTVQAVNIGMATEPSAVGVVQVVMVAGVYIAHQVDTHIK